MNVSTNCPKQTEKIASINGKGGDFCFMSDMRLSNNTVKEDLARFWLLSTKKNYQCFFNSTKSKRGVGILISKNLNYEVDKVLKDDKKNIICV